MTKSSLKSMLHLIGTGLQGFENLTIEAKNILDKSDYIYIDYYTSKLGTDITEIEKKLGKKIITAERELLEQSDEILNHAKNNDVSLLVVGDPLAATTHNSFRLDAIKKGINVDIIHNASVFTAIANTGLEMYKFGGTCSISYPVDEVYSKVPYEIIEKNIKSGFHTLCLFDIKIRQIDPKHYMEYMKTGKKKYLPDKFMTPDEAIEILFHLEKEHKKGIINEKTKAFVCSRLGHGDEKIISGTLSQLKNLNYVTPLYSLVIPAKEMHFVEEEFYNHFKI